MAHLRQEYAIAVGQSSTEAGPTSGVSRQVLLLAVEAVLP